MRNKTAILSNPVTMTSFLLMVSSIKAARIFVFETAEILASTIYLCINTENLNQSIEWSIPLFIYLSSKVTVSTKIKIEKKLVRLNVIHVSVAKHGCFFFSSYWTRTGAHYLERSTPILDLCHGVFTERFNFKLSFRGK